MSKSDEALDLLNEIAREDRLDRNEYNLLWDAIEQPGIPDRLDTNFLRHVESVMAGTLNYCQPMPRQDYEDDGEECGKQCLAELESLRGTIKAMLAAQETET